ncbi:hypothetical protein EV383_4235 [Pseudonocardia sediminis]|uniref:Uncharacterized protein n=1 Tax=Pseudonocardia sediminis TaxID=1397368 RepID=A0A4Q7V3Z9_PSEST|nr:hypothetical protein [Pseudonocardia sediminis]RZT87319.1 hypothetical protein EV383_4235 [Pseudonocardia sediminis]
MTGSAAGDELVRRLRRAIRARQGDDGHGPQSRAGARRARHEVLADLAEGREPWSR